MFAKRKYNRGKRDGNGLWVFGGVEKRLRPGGTQRRYFVCIVPDRTKETLKTAILAYIEQGSIITSDCWAAYKWLSEADSDYEHLTVNHSETYKDPETGACTNTIEATRPQRHP